MSDFTHILYIALRVGFVVIIPAIIIYFRVKKKIKTSFAIGAIITSLLLSLFTYSVKREPVKTFYQYINNNEYKKAKTAYKIVIQYGPEYVKKLDENKIYNKKLYHKIRREVIIEYKKIIAGILTKATLVDGNDCEHMKKNRSARMYLRHARLLLSFSESIGATYPEVKKQIISKLKQAKKRTVGYEKKCKSQS